MSFNHKFSRNARGLVERDHRAIHVKMHDQIGSASFFCTHAGAFLLLGLKQVRIASGPCLTTTLALAENPSLTLLLTVAHRANPRQDEQAASRPTKTSECVEKHHGLAESTVERPAGTRKVRAPMPRSFPRPPERAWKRDTSPTHWTPKVKTFRLQRAGGGEEKRRPQPSSTR